MAAPTLSGSAIAPGTSIALPAHAVGDLIIIFAFLSGSNSTPTVPSAGGTVPTWNQGIGLNPTLVVNTCNARTVWTIATATNHTSGSFSNSQGLIAAVISAGTFNTTSPFGNTSPDGYSPPYYNGNGTTGVSATQTLIPFYQPHQQNDGQNLTLGFTAHRNGSWGSAPAGWTRQQTAVFPFAGCLNTKDSTGYYTSGYVPQSLTGASTGYCSIWMDVCSASGTTKSPSGPTLAMTMGAPLIPSVNTTNFFFAG